MSQTFTAADWLPFATVASAMVPTTPDATAVLSATETTLETTLTTGDLWIRYTVPNRLGDTPLAPIGVPWGAWAALLGRIPAAKDLLSTLTDDTPPRLTLRMGRYRATLTTQPLPPTLDSTPWLEEKPVMTGAWNTTTLETLKRRHHHACPANDARPALGHWHWQYDGAAQAWQITTTDGVRLIRSQLSTTEAPTSPDTWLIPRALWTWLDKIARTWPTHPLSWTVTPHYLRFQCGPFLLAVPRPSLTFPDIDTVLWPRLVTAVPDTTTTMERAPLHDALGRLLRWVDKRADEPVQWTCAGDHWHLAWHAQDGALALDEWGSCAPIPQEWSALFAPRLLADLIHSVSADLLTVTFAPAGSPPFLRVTASDDPLHTTSVLLPVQRLAGRQEAAS